MLFGSKQTDSADSSSEDCWQFGQQVDEFLAVRGNGDGILTPQSVDGNSTTVSSLATSKQLICLQGVAAVVFQAELQPLWSSDATRFWFEQWHSSQSFILLRGSPHSGEEILCHPGHLQVEALVGGDWTCSCHLEDSLPLTLKASSRLQERKVSPFKCNKNWWNLSDKRFSRLLQLYLPLTHEVHHNVGRWPARGSGYGLCGLAGELSWDPLVHICISSPVTSLVVAPRWLLCFIELKNNWLERFKWKWCQA